MCEGPVGNDVEPYSQSTDWQGTSFVAFGVLLFTLIVYVTAIGHKELSTPFFQWAAEWRNMARAILDATVRIDLSAIPFWW